MECLYFIWVAEDSDEDIFVINDNYSEIYYEQFDFLVIDN